MKRTTDPRPHGRLISTRTSNLTSIALFAVTFLVFGFSRSVDLGDAKYSMVLSESILLHQTSHLNWCRFPDPIPTISNSTPPINSLATGYQLGMLNGSVVYRYPNGTSLLSVPFVALENLAGVSAVTKDNRYYVAGDLWLQKLTAALLMAALTVVVFHTALLLLDGPTSCVIALAFAFGTQVWSTATRALPSHTWLLLLQGCAVYVLLQWEIEGTTLRPILLATLISLAYFARPTAAVAIVCVTAYVFLFSRRDFLAYAATGALWFAAFVGYSWLTFGELIPGYYQSRLDFSAFTTSLLANLVSPSRGFFVYVPASLFVVYLIACYWKSIPARRLATLALATILLLVIAVAGYPCWWAGASYGARIMTDVLPWLALLAILGAAGCLRARETFSAWETSVAAALIALSIFMNGRGATSLACQFWSRRVSIDAHPERIFDWSYPQFAAGLIAPPPYVRALPARRSQESLAGKQAAK